VARAASDTGFLGEALLAIQKDLVAIMGELATAMEDLERYARDGYPGFRFAMVDTLERQITQIEAQNLSFKGWATPGATLHSAALDVARTVCRRAERRISELQVAGELSNAGVLTYFNRLSDLLWLMARWVEARGGDSTARTAS
jgi:cob(I)alamin adenosyltransferase